MPIIFVHGVGSRNEKGFPPIKELLKYYIAPIVNPADPAAVNIVQAFWGDLGAKFRWDNESQPRGPVLGMGVTPGSTVDQAILLATSQNSSSQTLPVQTKAAAGNVIALGPSSGPASTNRRLKDLGAQELSDLTASIIANATDDQFVTGKERGLALIAADKVAYDSETGKLLAKCTDYQTEIAELTKLIKLKYDELNKQAGGVAGQGMGKWFQNFVPKAEEAFGRATDLPGFIVGRVASEFRTPLNSFITNFFGDVFTYLDQRGDKDSIGPIPLKVLETLRAAKDGASPKEPLIVLTHSMGGQIVYDLVTYFLPNCDKYKDITIDYWCATASQVGLFEELKLFKTDSEKYSKATGQKIPFPKSNLKNWLNVWDYNDFVSYTGKTIFEDVDDISYNSGMFLLKAHGGYLERPSFYRELAEKIDKVPSLIS